MITKIDQFLLQNKLETPFLVVDTDIVRKNYRALRKYMPLAEVFYAVKANPAWEILSVLVGEGSSFDAASFQEIEMCLLAGSPVGQIAYGNVIKKSSDIAKAHALGIELFAFDSVVELEKLSSEAPGAKVYCRISVEGTDADWPLSRKFGCEMAMAVNLMRYSRCPLPVTPLF